ncbi:hypothetical protein LCGC14_0507150 [marine sediment metagenome]|uniref:Polymerase nucleotidyl transferase domain-containing protein n=1 Tax=marine sediment metagenome TaxID=412755 RepID=A0A0F9VAR6_9ZZZZ
MNIEKILKKFKKQIQQLYGDRLKNVILYGSYARNEETVESDLDLAIIIEGEISPFKEIDNMSEITYEYVLNHDILISIYPISEERYLLTKTPFLINIREDGILI